VSDPKPILVLWSKAAADAAATNITSLQSRLLVEATDITSGAYGWFMHALPVESEDACFLCNGREDLDAWTVFVRAAVFKPMAPIPDDHPDPARRGKVFKMPEATEEPDNEIFAEFSVLVG